MLSVSNKGGKVFPFLLLLLLCVKDGVDLEQTQAGIHSSWEKCFLHVRWRGVAWDNGVSAELTKAGAVALRRTSILVRKAGVSLGKPKGRCDAIRAVGSSIQPPVSVLPTYLSTCRRITYMRYFPLRCIAQQDGEK